jgi:sugar/nucleoside kinase (ribokinase family)
MHLFNVQQEADMPKNVYVIGELNVDIIMTGKDIMPELNREKLLDTFDILLGSSSAITATGLAGLGLNVFLVSIVGDDHFGHYCIDQLQKMGVDTRYVTIDPSLQTGVTLSISTEKDRALLTYMGAITQLTPELIPDELYTDANHIHFGSYFLQDGMRNHWTSLFKKALALDISTSFDTGWDLHGKWYREKISELIEYTELFIPSEDELLQIYDVDQLEDALARLPQNHKVATIKQGSKGAIMKVANGDVVSAKPFPVIPIDTTGAGDSFNAGLIYGYLAGKESEDMLQFACACGALATQRIGGASAAPNVQEVEAFMAIRS